MKRIAIITVILLAVLLAGCTNEFNQIEKQQEPPPSFTLVYSGENYKVIFDNDTHVMYWLSNGLYNQGTLTLLVKPDGTPKLWEGQ